MEDLIRKYALKNRADYGEAQKKAVIGKVFADNPELKKDAGKVVKKAGEVVAKINQLSEEEVLKEMEKHEYFEKEREEGLPELPNVDEEKGVVMRMAPFPSGMLHIGNARMAVLNDEYVKRYDGKLYLVIDDTAGSEEKKPIPEAYEEIPKDLEWLGIEIHEIIRKSDRMNIFYEYGEKFLEEGWAYVCKCDAKTLRENRKKGLECSHRSNSPDENLKEWKKMIKGHYNQGDAVVRLKTDMNHKDPAFRDRVLLRVSHVDHPMVDREYDVWPMLEFSWAIDDHKLGITHILRGKDLMMENKMERYMWDLLGWEEPEILNHGLMNIEGITISTSKAKKNIDEGKYIGWEDPRTWSLKSLKKRGFKPEAIRNFVLSFGMSESNVTVPVKSLYTENRKIIDEEADRYFFLENPVKLEIKGLKEKKIAEADLHPEFPERGFREIEVVPKNGVIEVLIEKDDFEKGKEIRLKDLLNIKIEEDGVKMIGGGIDYALDNNLPIIQWLPAEDNKKCTIVMPDGSEKTGLCESNLEKEGDVIQFIRKGFVNPVDVGSEEATCFFTHN